MTSEWTRHSRYVCLSVNAWVCACVRVCVCVTSRETRSRVSGVNAD